jgi:hypothetical protein
MKIVKNMVIGFLVSFIGSIPLGYLNVIGYEIYSKSNIYQLIFYLIGVVIIEAIVIYGTLFFAEKLSLKPKLNRNISLFSILFLAVLTYYFYHASQSTKVSQDYLLFLTYPSFIIGIILSVLNFAQIPFWLSWNLYLVNEKYISESRNLKIYYFTGTLLGTFLGMLALIVGIQKISKAGVVNSNFLSSNIWIIFLVLTLFQIVQFVRKKQTK